MSWFCHRKNTAKKSQNISDLNFDFKNLSCFEQLTQVRQVGIASLQLKSSAS